MKDIYVKYIIKDQLLSIIIQNHLNHFICVLMEDNKTVAAMDVLVPGVGELIGGSQREERIDKLLDFDEI